jgi:hypothetical protein
MQRQGIGVAVIRLILGGPSYRMEVDARHAAFLVTFALRAIAPRVIQRKTFGGLKKGPPDVTILGTAYEHGTPVAYARNHLFEGALGVTDATHLAWLDSDCSYVPSQIDDILHALRSLGDRPMFGVPAPQRDRHANVWLDREMKLEKLSLDGALHPCHAVGFGCVFFNLNWYRREWPKAPWFQDRWDPEIGYMSEDYGHCRELAARGVVPLYAGAYVDHHDRGEGKPLTPDVAERAAG